MSIRRKLFLAFLAVPLPPVVMVIVMSNAYLDHTRSALDERFLEEARSALREADRDAQMNRDSLGGDLNALVTFLADAPPLRFSSGQPHSEIFQVQVARHALSSDGIADRVHTFEKAHPEVVGVRVIEDEDTVYSSGDAEKVRFEIPGYVPSGSPPIVRKDGNTFLVAISPDNLVEVIVHVDPARLLAPRVFQSPGAVFQYDLVTHKPAHAPEDLQMLKGVPVSTLKDVALRADQSVRVGPPGLPWRAVTMSSEVQAYGLTLVAMTPEAGIYQPLLWGQFLILLTASGSLGLALWLAWFLSRRFVGSVDRIRSGVEALSRGEWASLEKSSADELGGGLVESLNQMALKLAERTRNEEVEGWRRLVRVLSHEINNTLGPVRSVAATVRDQIAGRVQDPDAAEDLQVATRLIVDRTDALTAFIAGYAEVAKLPKPERSPVSVDGLVADSVKLLEEAAAIRRVEVSVACAPHLGTALLDRAQIERVLINLVKNAVEAASEGGHVRIAASRLGGTVEILVEDDGPGISSDARRHLFVPYFTTKAGGSGIGLALVRQIVLGHGGAITAEDRAEGGNRMRVRLPADVESVI